MEFFSKRKENLLKLSFSPPKRDKLGQINMFNQNKINDKKTILIP